MDNNFIKPNKFNKLYGQNFIFDVNFLNSIVDSANINKETSVLEIGAGAGTLTKALCNKAKKVVSYEIDKSLSDVLNTNLNDVTNLELVFNDIMKEEISLIEKKFENNYVIVANLPYYITTPIIFKFIENAEKLSAMYIMVQYEVATRLTAKENTANYGAITPAIDIVADAKIIKKVSRKMFVPMPNVDSAIVEIKMNKNKYHIEDVLVLRKVIKSAFGMRRKTLINNLKNDFNLNVTDLYNIFKKLNLDIMVRGEALSSQQFVELANIIVKFI